MKLYLRRTLVRLDYIMSFNEAKKASEILKSDRFKASN